MRRTAAACARPHLPGWDERIDAVLTRFGDARVVAEGTGHCQAQMLHARLVADYGFTGSYQSVRRHFKRRFVTPPIQRGSLQRSTGIWVYLHISERTTCRTLPIWLGVSSSSSTTSCRVKQLVRIPRHYDAG